jgi:hypothetical protein
MHETKLPCISCLRYAILLHTEALAANVHATLVYDDLQGFDSWRVIASALENDNQRQGSLWGHACLVQFTTKVSHVMLR